MRDELIILVMRGEMDERHTRALGRRSGSQVVGFSFQMNSETICSDTRVKPER